MRFEDIQGNDAVKQALAGMVNSGHIPHAIMFHEDDGGGAMAFCQAFLQLLIPTDRVARMIHLDVHYSFPISGDSSLQYMTAWRELVISNPYFTENQLSEALGIEGKNSLISVSEAKAILDSLSLNAIEGGYRAVVIYLPEKMNAMAANKLLKAIEEPSEKTVFLLITHAPEKVLVTIASRCQNIRIKPTVKAIGRDDLDDPYVRDLFEDMMTAFTRMDLGTALSLGEKAASLPSREKAKAFCKYASDRLRNVFLIQQGMGVLAGQDPFEAELASKLKKTFPRKASESLSRATMLIERNVNMKILFTDLVDRLYLNM